MKQLFCIAMVAMVFIILAITFAFVGQFILEISK